MDSWQAAQLAASSICIKMKRWCWDNFTGCKQRPLYLFFHKTIPVLKEHNLHCCQQRYGGISRELSFCSLWTKDRHPITAICFFRLNLKVLVMLIFYVQPTPCQRADLCRPSNQGAVSKMCRTAFNTSILINLMLLLVIYLSPMPER